MSIEHGVTTGASKAHAKAPQAAGAGAGKSQTGAAAPGGFASLLLSLGAEASPVSDMLPEAGEDSLATLPGAAESPAEAGVLPVEAALTGIALPQLSPSAAPAAMSQTQESSDSLAGRVTAGPGVPAAAVRGVAGREEDRAALAGERRDAATADGKEAGVAPGGDVQPLLRQAGLAQRMAQHRSQAAESVVQSVKEQRGEDLAARLGWRTSENFALATGQSQALLAAGAGEAGLRPFERRGDRDGARIIGGVGEGNGWSGPTQAEGARLDVPAVAPDGGLTTEMRVAEQVSYWIGRGAQNAELEVDGLGEGPVKVSIELQGQEARVEFRADQAQTRQVLEDSMPHLRELLEREGLVLSGMSVGSSGAETGHGQSSQGRQGGRQAQMAAPEAPVAALAAQRAAPLSGRSVDLFV